MAKIIKQYKETDEMGIHSVKEYSNGIKVRNLINPSEKYIKKRQLNSEKQKKIQEEKKKIKEREKLIQDRMRQLAIEELKKEGKL